MQNLWTVAPKREENVYSSLDATVFASLFSTIINNCDSIKMACVAQLVNVIAPILTDANGGAVKQTIFYPYELISNNIKGEAVKCSESDNLQSSFVIDKEGGEAILLVCNLTDGKLDVDVNIEGVNATAYEKYSMAGDAGVYNTFENPFASVPVKTAVNGNSLILDGYSWNIVKYKINK